MRVRIAGVAVLMAGVWLIWAAVLAPPGPRTLKTFDPERVAALELDMWQAYYGQQRVRLFRGLVTLLHEQNRYSWAKAGRASFHLARAASRFAGMREGYETVLPDLERAYAIERDWVGASYDPKAVARAELAWWVARRLPGQDGEAQVGALIAEENALRFGVPVDRVLQASALRARAARLRDQGGRDADWAQVGDLLRQSYRELHRAVQ
jgi:hypothetical protein